MNPILRKELRMLMPAWIGALVTATAPLWMGWDNATLSIYIFGAGILMLGLAPFGQEMSFGTFGLLLAQPAKRRNFWRMKAGLVAVAIASVVVVAEAAGWASYWISPHYRSESDLFKWEKISALVGVLAFTGGLWTTLLFRQVTTAIWCTILVPSMICAGINLTEIEKPDSFLEVALLVYALAGFWFARWLFLRAQDTQWTGGDLSLPAGTFLRRFSFGFGQRRTPWVALIQKEVQLHSITLVLVPLLAVIHLAALVVRHFAKATPEKIVDLSWIWACWLIAPLIIGCVAVAEERRHNTLESQLCLPMRKRSSFAVKFSVVMLLGMVLGAVLPFLMEQLGLALGLPSGIGQSRDFENLLLTSTIIAAVSFCGSTLSRTMIEAVSVALAGFVAGSMIFGLVLWQIAERNPLFRSEALRPVAWILTIGTFLWLAFRNYKSLQISGREWRVNLAAVGALGVGVVLIPAGIYERPWEFLLSLEPEHGPARLTGNGKAKIADGANGLSILLPDGRLWVGKVKVDGSIPETPRGGFTSESNWIDVAVNNAGVTVGLKADGTLWTVSATNQMQQVGSDFDWKQVSGNGSGFAALKRNGTVWIWGDSFLRTPDPKDIGWVEPQYGWPPLQMWRDTTWSILPAYFDSEIIGVARDGQVRGGDGPHMDGRDGKWARRHADWNMGEGVWISLGFAQSFVLGVRADGTLWGAGILNSTMFGEECAGGLQRQAVRVGHKSDWLGVSGRWGYAVGWEANGELWATRMRQGSMGQKNDRRPSEFHDWVAAKAQFLGDGLWALARDGTVSHWDDRFDKTGNNLLRRSRRPVSFNILDLK